MLPYRKTIDGRSYKRSIHKKSDNEPSNPKETAHTKASLLLPSFFFKLVFEQSQAMNLNAHRVS